MRDETVAITFKVVKVIDIGNSGIYQSSILF